MNGWSKGDARFSGWCPMHRWMDKILLVQERRWVILLLLLTSALRLFAAVTVELGNDEVYYRMYAGHLQWNYFDHPPMVAWVIRLFTLNLLADYDVMIRMASLFFAAASTWMMFRCGELLHSARAGMLASVLYASSIYCSVIAGTFIMPDSPQVFFWIMALYHALHIANEQTTPQQLTRSLLLFGVFTGLGMLSKVHTVFLWGGLGLYLLFYRRSLLRHPALYVAVFIMMLLFSPVIWWNIGNGFATFFFHGKRVDVAAGQISIERMLTFVAGQIVYCNPVVFGIITAGLLKRSPFPSAAHRRILFCTSLPLIGVATAGALFRDLLPHWTGPGFIALILLAAVSIAAKPIEGGAMLPPVFKIALGLLCFVVLAGSLLVNIFPGTLGSKDDRRLGDGDFTLDMYGWEEAGEKFAGIYRARHGSGASADSALLLCEKWFPAAHLQHYVTAGLPVRLIALGPVEDIHQYHWENLRQGLPADSVDLYWVNPSNYYADLQSNPLLAPLQPVAIDTIIQYRGGLPARKFYVHYFGRQRVSIPGFHLSP